MESGISGKPIRVHWPNPAGEGKLAGYVIGFLLNSAGEPCAVVEHGWEFVLVPLSNLTIVNER